MTSELHQTQKGSLSTMTNVHTKYEKYPLSLSWNIRFTRHSLFDLWWPQMTSDFHQKGIGFFQYDKFRYHTKYEVSIDVFEILFTRFLTSGNLKWPLTSTKNKWVLPLNMINLDTKYVNCPSFPSWGTLFQTIFKFFVIHLWWPQLLNRWPLPKTIAFIFRVMRINAKCEKYPCFLPWDNHLYKVLKFWPTGDLTWPLTFTKKN